VLPIRDNVPTRGFPIVTVALIAANAVVWFWELGGRGLDYHVFAYSFYPCSVDPPCLSDVSTLRDIPWYESLFSSMFMHASWSHILGNMLFLWIFGNNVEDAMGRGRFLAFYVLGGLAASVSQLVVTLLFSSQVEESIPNLGASGAIAAVLGAYLVLLPNASVLTFIGFFLVPIPAILFLGFWFLFQLWEGGFAILHPEAGGGVAFFAHVGGFVFGLLVVTAFAVRRPLRPSW
jgi:membrane associated rhomboid family serine protease